MFKKLNKYIGLSVWILILNPISLYSQQPLETETARLLKAKSLEFEGTFEFQTSSEGTEKSVPIALIYGISNKFEFMVEPVLYTSITPKSGTQAKGFGDIETTL